MNVSLNPISQSTNQPVSKTSIIQSGLGLDIHGYPWKICGYGYGYGYGWI